MNKRKGRREGKGHGKRYTGTKAETPDTAKREPKARANSGPERAESVEERRLAKENLREQTMHRTQGRARMQQALTRIRSVAKKDKEAKFTALLHHVWSLDTLTEAYFRLDRKAAAGVDGVTWEEYGQDLKNKLQDLSERLKRGGYRARPVRRVHIPKEDGRTRPIGITTVEDKLVQLAVVMTLNAIYEEDFLGFSYGFRPGRSQHNALDAVTVGIERKRVNWVLDADIRGFFDTIDHAWLVKFVEHRIGDKRVVRLIQKWLNAGVLENGKRTQSEKGTPQGGSVSPLLANIYLHYVLDVWAQRWRMKRARGEIIIVRYADDVVFGFQHRADADQFQQELSHRMDEFGLELHPEKTRLIEFGRYATERREGRAEGKPQTFDFLGFTHYCGQTRAGEFALKRRTMTKRMRRKLKEVKSLLQSRMHWPVPELGKWLRSVLTGHYQYYGVPHNIRALSSMRHQTRRLWRRALSRRSQKGYVTESRMDRLAARWLPRPWITHPYPNQRLRV